MFLKIPSPKPEFPLLQWRSSRKRRSLLLLPLAGACLWLGYRHIQQQSLEPEAIVVLGGHENRERLAAKLAARHPNLPIWVSSGSPEGYAERIFARAGIAPNRLHLDYRAKDTVTNFTTLVDELKARGIDSVYLVTSDSHMRRACLVGELVFGTHGIAIKPVAVPAQESPESPEKCLRDSARAFLWLFTGSTGENWRSWLSSYQ
jgi:uncharacterized SAM-binding protein YcdF (DUF218 family)